MHVAGWESEGLEGEQPWGIAMPAITPWGCGKGKHPIKMYK